MATEDKTASKSRKPGSGAFYGAYNCNNSFYNSKSKGKSFFKFLRDEERVFKRIRRRRRRRRRRRKRRRREDEEEEKGGGEKRRWCGGRRRRRGRKEKEENEKEQRADENKREGDNSLTTLPKSSYESSCTSNIY
ncbi:hypothetical protein ElyMa_000567100 [Elysia marginata]|uniref:Uncharacterized protein n=1 Tax=Elysia marginata TaxID=1093978 RepID=A0AAV4G436_9GAST|nr:hypothetical protein ElyMa_000567100 [Elysia marginata]